MISSAILFADIALTAAVALLAVTLTAVRVEIRRRHRRYLAFHPAASRAVAMYIAGVGPPPQPGSQGERDALREVALSTVTDLTGSERQTVVRLLEDLGFVDDAVAGLTSRRRSRRRGAAEQLALIQSPQAIPALTAGLDDQDALVRTSCARTLAEIGGPQLGPRLAAVAAADMTAVPGAAAAVVLALGRHHPDALEPLLAPAAPAPVRAVAVSVAGRLRLAQLSPSLRECLSGGDGLAGTAAQGLGMIGDIEAAGRLRELADDSGSPLTARAAAVTALGSIGDPAAVPVLEPLLTAPDWQLRAAAASALSWLGEPGSWALRRAVSLGPPEAREQAEAVLAR
jgi:HEAT repeat protein